MIDWSFPQGSIRLLRVAVSIIYWMARKSLEDRSQSRREVITEGSVAQGMGIHDRMALDNIRQHTVNARQPYSDTAGYVGLTRMAVTRTCSPPLVVAIGSRWTGAGRQRGAETVHTLSAVTEKRATGPATSESGRRRRRVGSPFGPTRPGRSPVPTRPSLSPVSHA